MRKSRWAGIEKFWSPEVAKGDGIGKEPMHVFLGQAFFFISGMSGLFYLLAGLKRIFIAMRCLAGR